MIIDSSNFTNFFCKLKGIDLKENIGYNRKSNSYNNI